MIDWLAKLLFKISPRLGVKYIAKKTALKHPKAGEAHDFFKKVDRIDFHPFKYGRRGFVMVLDGKTALYFAQDNDRFIYKGYEIGDFDKGDVTIFDELR